MGKGGALLVVYHAVVPVNGGEMPVCRAQYYKRAYAARLAAAKAAQQQLIRRRWYNAHLVSVNAFFIYGGEFAVRYFCVPQNGVHLLHNGYKQIIYLRRFVRECKALGAHPILLSLTPRNAWDTKRPGHIARVDGTFGLWARQVAEEQGIPFVDLNEISASKYDRFSAWKVDYHFYRDRIHTSAFGARLNARSAAEGLAASTHPALKALQACLTNLEPPAAQVKREKGKPVVFITGDSTVKNEDKDPDGMWGWGSQAGTIFDTDKITVANEAKAGRSTRTYLEENRWERVYNALQPGDFVLIQFGHNDIGDIDRGKARGVIACAQDTSHVYRVNKGDKIYNEVIYSFGWYLKKFIDDVREKGATPILVSLTPRNEWPGGKIERRNRRRVRGLAQHLGRCPRPDRPRRRQSLL